MCWWGGALDALPLTLTLLTSVFTTDAIPGESNKSRPTSLFVPPPGITVYIYFDLYVALGLHRNKTQERQGLYLSRLHLLSIC